MPRAAARSADRSDELSGEDGLTREAVLAAGVEIVAEEGFQRLSMRRLASRLGVWPTAIYHYLPDRQQVGEAIADTIMSTVVTPPETVEPIEWLRAMAWDMRRVGLANPGLAAYLMEAGATGPHGLALGDGIAARLHDLGHVGDELAQAYNLFLTWLTAAIGKTDRFMQRGGAEGVADTMAFMAALDVEEYPSLAAMQDGFLAMPEDPDSVFEWSLERMLRSLASTSTA
ncbi:TetR/AcrR family transcriptional regulator [Euzebya tangerina]|uniref:TetR/AcrR family transcriptional regulator n=1 Tax=Euzebya tangerina TaxID=591198 RepID=UPI000E315E5D|nr:TetR/AcrR family transcriptional regulator [Euzebya tangerina]